MKELELKRVLKNLSELEITDHGFDISITIYQVCLIKDDCNDELQFSFTTKDAAIKWIEKNSNEENKYYWIRNYVWFND